MTPKLGSILDSSAFVLQWTISFPLCRCISSIFIELFLTLDLSSKRSIVVFHFVDIISRNWLLSVISINSGILEKTCLGGTLYRI